MRQQKSLTALLLALVFVLAGCKGESPTAPPPGGGSGGGNPPTGLSMTLTASNANPVVDSVSVITAVVTQNGQPVPNGTAVEFQATGGSFSATETITSILRTTINGAASVELRSTVAGSIRVQAAAGSISRFVDVLFRVSPTIPPPTSTAPSITSVTPAIGVPTGGTRITIVGKNFKEPVRVLFDTGAALPVEAFVISRSDTVIEVFTPSVNLGAGQQLLSDIIVITQAGTASEARAELADAFTFRNEQLTPRISTATPNSGPVTGGTRITIFGDGFQAPVQVLFGSAEARVITVEFSQIIVEAPAGRDTNPDGSGTVTGPVTITVRNIQSATSTTLSEGFRYVAAIQITAVGPSEGPYTGGTRISIDGIGFLAPVTISVAGFPVQPLSVTGTKIIAITPGIVIQNCTEVSGPVIVTNVVNGDSASGASFTFRVPRPIIVNVNPPVANPGDPITVTVANAQPGINRIRIGTRTVFPTGVVFNPDGSATFSLTLPLDFTFTTEACTVGTVQGTRQVPLRLDVSYLNVDTGCSDTATEALTINPPSTACILPPPPGPPEVTLTSPVGGACADAGNVAIGSTTPGTATISFRNDGESTLNIARGAVTGPDAAAFTVLPSSAAIEPGLTGSFTVSFDPAVVGAHDASVAFTTNDADEALFNICLEGNGTP